MKTLGEEKNITRIVDESSYDTLPKSLGFVSFSDNPSTQWLDIPTLSTRTKDLSSIVYMSKKLRNVVSEVCKVNIPI